MDKLHPKILILTYNLTLRNFIRDKLIQVHRDFEIADFTIINYHQFIKAELNNMEIEMEIPHKNKGMEIEEYYDKYYSNEQLFAKNKDKILEIRKRCQLEKMNKEILKYGNTFSGF